MSPDERITLEGAYPTSCNKWFLWGLWFSTMDGTMVYTRLVYDAVKVRQENYKLHLRRPLLRPGRDKEEK